MFTISGFTNESLRFFESIGAGQILCSIRICSNKRTSHRVLNQNISVLRELASMTLH
jgi:hypothetical protein